MTQRRVTNTGETAPPCGSFSGTATCSAARARTSTRGRSRVSGAGHHDVVVVSQEANPELHDLGGAQTVRPDIGGLLPVFVLDRYEGMEAKLLQDTSQEERDRFVESNASVLRELAPADLVFANHVLLGSPVGAASGLPFAVKAHGSSSSTRCAATRSSRAGDARRSPTPAPSSSARRTSGRCSRTSSATSTASTRSSRGRRRRFHPEARPRRSPSCSRRRRDQPNPAARTSGSPTRATPSGSKSSSRRKRRRFSTSAS